MLPHYDYDDDVDDNCANCDNHHDNDEDDDDDYDDEEGEDDDDDEEGEEGNLEASVDEGELFFKSNCRLLLPGISVRIHLTVIIVVMMIKMMRFKIMPMQISDHTAYNEDSLLPC